MKKLPELYKNPNIKPKDNNKKVYYMSENDTRQISVEKPKRVEEELEGIFNSLGYSYNIPVKITTKNNTYYTSLIAKTKQNILTIDNKTIPIADIIEITREK
jgi:hypothetical protein